MCTSSGCYVISNSISAAVCSLDRSDTPHDSVPISDWATPSAFQLDPAFVDDPSEIDLRDAHFHTAGNHFILHHLDYYILYHNRLKLQHYIDVLSMQIQQVNQHYQMRFLWASATANVHRRWTCALTKPWATQKTPADTYQTRWGHRFFFETDYIKEVKHPPPFIPQLTRRASFSWSRLNCLKKMCQVSSFFLSVCQKLHSDTTITLNVCGIGLLLERSCRRVFGYQLLSGFTFLVLTRCLTGVHHLQTEDQLAISSRWPTQSRFRSWSIWNFSCLTNAKKRLLNEDPELGNCPVLHLSKPRDLYLRIDDIEIPWENIDHVNSTKRLQTDFRCSQGWQDVPPPRGTRPYHLPNNVILGTFLVFSYSLLHGSTTLQLLASMKEKGPMHSDIMTRG